MKLINEITDRAWEILTEACSLTSGIKNRIRPKVIVKDTQRGRYKPWLDLVIIPQWAVGKGEHYLTYYVVHELTHVFFYSHDESFKKSEVEALDYFGISIKYTRAYPRTLSYNGKVFYEKQKRVARHYYRKAQGWYKCDCCGHDIGYGDMYLTYRGRKYCGRSCMFEDNPEYAEKFK